MSPPAHYVEEAVDLLPLLLEGDGAESRRTLRELGAGGGSLASHLWNHFTLTLTDRSAEMLEVSKRVNPGAEHMVGDMVTLDLGREFDRVLIHDAIMSATDPHAARATLQTAARHCQPGGRAIVVPGCVTESFEPSTEW